jgi:uncharacterized circularly permuted ATP-grasp superfamily protein
VLQYEVVGDLFDDYPADAAFDEMFEPTGPPRPGYRALHEAVVALSSADLEERYAVRDRSLRDQGITFSFSGEERTWPLDLIPRIISAEEWAVIEAGVIQRVRALEAFLADVYSGGQILDDGVIPRRLVVTSEGFLRQAAFLNPPNGVRVHVAGIDVVRGADGRFVVLEDNLRVPSGISYVVENRRTMARVFPEVFATHRVRPVADYPAHLLGALRAAAPPGRADPTVVVLTPGVYNAAYFEHAFLARQMGVELVEGRDLVCRDNVIFMRTTGGEQRVDVVYRRIDDEFLDPIQFRSDSMLGCPGILNAARAGNVALANAVGNGVADDKAIYPFVAAMIDYYLGERAILDTVPTYRLDVPEDAEIALSRVDSLVWKPVAESGGKGLVIGHQADDKTLVELQATVAADPRNWIAQEVVTLSTSPTHTGQRLAPRHIDLRPVAVNDGDRVWVVPGGLTRVALREGSLVVNSSAGGGSKDTWVLAGAGHTPETREERKPGAPLPRALRGPAQETGPASAAVQQQQQQQQ